MADRLFAEFPPVPTEAWLATIAHDLKGADFRKRLVTQTEDGLDVQPVYRREDVPPCADSIPGGAPFQRGFDANPDWAVREPIREANVGDANAHAIRCLGRGVDEIAFLVTPGSPVSSQAEFRALLDGVVLEAVPVHWMAGPCSPQILAMLLNEVERRGIEPADLAGSVECDPIMDSLIGWSAADPSSWTASAGAMLEPIRDRLPRFRTLTIRASLFQKAGGSAALELATAIGLFTEYLAGLVEAGFDGRWLAANTEFRFAVGSGYFQEIAKLRAARTLIANVVKAFGLEGVRPRLHVETTSLNKTLYDPHNNLLRTTTEAISAALGGADSITVGAFDQVFREPTEFGEHLARNTQTILKEEAFLAKVADPLGGAYFVERLTERLATASWDLFTEMEDQGGFLTAWRSGFVPERLAMSRGAKIKAAHTRRAGIVGTSTSPNPKETRLRDLGHAPVASRVWPLDRAFGPLREDLANGARLSEWETGEPVPDSPLAAFRPAAAFEELRLRVERHVAAGKARPRAFLAQLGDRKMASARAGFCTGFFGCGGYEVVSERPKDAAEAVQRSRDFEALVLCSADDAYPELVGQIAPLLSKASPPILVVAGNPTDHLDSLRRAGVEFFVHIRSDVVATITDLHARLGIGPSEERTR
ncbi:MAG: hypothetical protein KIS66_03060 [Fimbriimonadaceae bacterium]|nr:hypothetical protein [Fimbriimonadaceae bacterium]